MQAIHRSVISLAALLTASLASQAAPMTNADEIVAASNLASYYAGADGRSEVRMLIRDAQGREQRRQFTVLRRNVESGGDQDFLVVFSRPSDVRGTVYLVKKHVGKDDDRWLYLPGLDLVKRISAGDKRTSFVGADYFYEDVSGRGPDEDTHALAETTDKYYVLTHEPKDTSERRVRKLYDLDRQRDDAADENRVPEQQRRSLPARGSAIGRSDPG